MKIKATFCLLILFFLSSCAGHRTYIKSTGTWHAPQKKFSIIKKSDGSYIVNGERYFPMDNSSGFVQVGEASWYGKKFHGLKTADGEVYNMYGKSAAHKVLPFGTIVKVENLSNHKSTIVRINDRGPFVKGRIIDLSYAAAKEINLIGPGTAKVKITVLEKNKHKKPMINKGVFTVQVGAFSKKKNALRLAKRLKVIFDYVKVSEFSDENNNRLFRLHVTKSYTLNNASVMEKKLEKMGFTEAFIVRL